MEASLNITEVAVESNEGFTDKDQALAALRELSGLELVLVGGGNTTATYY